MTWSEVKQLWDEGYKKYIHQWWNWLDFIMLSLYLATFALRTVAYYMVRNGNFGPETLVRTYWKSDEPVLVSESLFAVANVFSFARIIYLFQMNPYLGPLQISLGCMLIDIAKFFFLFFLILSSFAIGLVQLYWYYSPLAKMCEQTDHVCLESISTFTSMADSYITLIWSLFSITNTKSTDVGERHEITQWTGRALYIAYHVTSIIVLLNMLIAMMSHSFQRINDHADLEWKFHRTQLWMGFFDEGSTLTAPFNIIITPKTGLNFLRKSYCVFKWSLGKSEWPKAKRRPTIKRPRYLQRMREVEEASEMPEPKLTYETIMQRLVSRYIHQTKKKSQMEGINEDELLEIKQDISSLRYELREERRKELARTSSNFDGIKREILRTLSSADRVYQPRTAQERGRNGIERANTNLPLRVAVPENDSAENPTTDETRIRHHLRLGRSPDRRAVEDLKTSIAENVCKHMEAKMQEWLVAAFKTLETKNDQEQQPTPSV